MTAQSQESDLSADSSKAQQQARLTYHYLGRVQGVGFRATVHEIAQRFAVHGWVKNCEDGSVECVVEGQREEIQAFDEAIREARSRHVHDVRVNTGMWVGDLSGFKIRY